MLWLLLFKVLVPLADCQLPKSPEQLALYNDTPLITCESRSIPKWLKGYFIRQMCGSLGRTSFGGPLVSHFFDCAGMLGIYRINNGLVHFTSRFHQTHALKSIRENTGRDGIGWRTFRTKTDENVCLLNEQQRPDMSPYNPNLAFSSHGNFILAYSHGPEFYQVDFREPMRENSSSRLFARRHPEDPIVLHDTVYKTMDKNGTLWGTYLAAHSHPHQAEIARYIYKVEKGCQQKVIVAKIPTGTVYREMCRRLADGRWVYAAPMVEGYVHSTAVTEHYILLAMNRGTFNPCLLLTLGDDVARVPLLQNFEFEFDNSKKLEATVIDKQSLKVKFIDIPGEYRQTILLRTVNAFEEQNGQYLYLDAIAYDALLYFNFFELQNLYAIKEPFPGAVIFRLKIDVWMKDIQMERLQTEFLHIDYPVINPAFLGSKSYKYIYAVQEPFAKHSVLLKMDISQRESLGPKAWKLPSTAAYLNEIAFVQFPRGTAEDEGLLLASAADPATNKGFLYLIDARTMQEMGNATIPGAAMFGFYADYLPSSATSCPDKFVFLLLFSSLSLNAIERSDLVARWSDLGCPQKIRWLSRLTKAERFVPPTDLSPQGFRRTMGDGSSPGTDDLRFYEEQFEHLSKQVDLLLADLRGSLAGMSHLAAENIAAFESVTNSTCESMEAAIRASHAYIVGLETQLKNMQSLRGVAAEIAQFRLFLEQCDVAFNSP
uniref:BLOC-1-related complex subunit 6 C-terminal helix domain-containing protein n=1 Tax=Trichuris muris TaxID=70415 RepID=A0A5S6R5N0_TRIMR